ncbi:forespore capture DNA-binding protein RefZ [Bacillus sp. V3B]|uniref:forespore capture DNA-binding protein RefZ n=1 Tax=Bacillus sp. V3B TaxID=2804915 RepID=UPI0021099688|nr:forespore capture DNA-binding protein RefZ [Bacillus sp. V3B]MCQ6274406.1 forespore capture DNA-binding protein RefZ [Bacillus sp. V3B]
MKKNSKDAIVQAAISLFNTKGFHGTTVRDIAGKANVNIANISYYFQNKNGLLEYCFTNYYEKYINELENGILELESGAYSSLKMVIGNILNFQCENIHLTRFILRELSLDTQIVREMMSTYLVKERYYLTKILEVGVARQEFKKVNANYFIIQLKGLLSMPFLNSQYLSEVLHVFPHEKYFADKYLKEIFDWLDGMLIPKQIQPSQYSVATPYTMKRVPLYRAKRAQYGEVSGGNLRYILERN